MIDLVATLCLAGHLLLVDIAMFGPIGGWLAGRKLGPNDSARSGLAIRLAVDSMTALAGAIVLGGALGWLLWRGVDESYRAALAVIPTSRWYFAAGELLFYFLAVAGFCWLARRRFSPVGQAILAWAAATNLMLHFPPLFAILSVLASRGAIEGQPLAHGEPLTRAQWYALLLDGEVIARVLHVWLAGAAVTGVWAAHRASRRPGIDKLIARRGAAGALAATAFQMPLGLWLFWQLPDAERAQFLGRDPWATALLGGGILLSMFAIQQLAAAWLADANRRQTRNAALAVATIVVFMTAALARVERHWQRPKRAAPISGPTQQAHDDR